MLLLGRLLASSFQLTAVGSGDEVADGTDSESHFLCRFARTFPALFSLSLYVLSPRSCLFLGDFFFVHFFLHCRRCCNLLCAVFFSGPAAPQQLHCLHGISIFGSPVNRRGYNPPCFVFLGIYLLLTGFSAVPKAKQWKHWASRSACVVQSTPRDAVTFDQYK